MRTFIAYFDSGTTNSRLFLLDENLNALGMTKKMVGARDSAISGSNRVWVSSLFEMYQSLLKEKNISDNEVSDIFLSGMITSVYGIKEVPHIVLPADSRTLAEGVAAVDEDMFFKRDVHLICGVKTTGKEISDIGNMRGEETELVGLADELKQRNLDDVAVILPGSHTHIAYVSGGSIVDCISNFTGELLFALQKDTILAPILEKMPEVFDEEMVALALRNLDLYGFNRAIYIAHAMKMTNAMDMERIRSYAYAVLNGGLRKVLENACRTKWTRCRTAVVLGGIRDGEFFNILFKGSEEIKSIIHMESADSSFALDGFRNIYKDWKVGR